MKLTGNVFLKIKKYAGLFLHITLIGSILYSIVQIILTSHGESASSHVQSDYVLMLVQCILGLVVMVLPSFLEKKLSFVIPNSMYVLYFVFLYCAIYLGEVRRFYYIIPFWDTILHAFSGGMLGAFGFLLVSVLNDAKTVRFELNPFFVALFAFCFALFRFAICKSFKTNYFFAAYRALFCDDCAVVTRHFKWCVTHQS